MGEPRDYGGKEPGRQVVWADGVVRRRGMQAGVVARELEVQGGGEHEHVAFERARKKVTMGGQLQGAAKVVAYWGVGEDQGVGPGLVADLDGDG